jgi:hypothetical protein
MAGCEQRKGLLVSAQVCLTSIVARKLDEPGACASRSSRAADAGWPTDRVRGSGSRPIRICVGSVESNTPYGQQCRHRPTPEVNRGAENANERYDCRITMLNTLAVSGYRSLRDLVISLDRPTLR